MQADSSLKTIYKFRFYQPPITLSNSRLWMFGEKMFLKLNFEAKLLCAILKFIINKQRNPVQGCLSK